MEFFVIAPYLATTESFDTLEDALREAERIAETILRDYTGAEARHLRAEGFTIGIVPDIGVSLRGSGSRADWHGIARPAVHADPNDTAEDQVKAGVDALSRAHTATVCGIATSILDDVASEAITDSDNLSERIHEDCDGCQDVIYTFKAKCLLLVSDNSDAYLEEFGEEAASVEAQACFALMTDVRECISRIADNLDSYASTLREKTLNVLTAHQFDPTDDSTYPATAPDADDLQGWILEGAGDCLHALAWASAVELASDIGDTDAPSLSGCEIMDVKPDTSEAAKARAGQFIGTVEARNETLAIGEYFRAKVLRPAMVDDTGRAGRDPEALAQDFGHCLAMEAIGHGVSWEDDHDDHGLKLPDLEYEEEFKFEGDPDAEWVGGDFEVGRGSRPDERFDVSINHEGTATITIWGRV